uniref:Diphosphoinositol pentakisphosphate kinase 2 N-terminal domain n=1 Tax=Inoviridae sp. ctDEu7 TaxID=2826759 RepID=A0A8S5MUN9_9VIRU|nr:MAG TPA: Diphosphoinositol pentakisphosphate kinase 2 N-terminal domain [Inoviridae sp. ctDEu7]
MLFKYRKNIDDIINSLHCAIEGWPWCDLIHCFN